MQRRAISYVICVIISLLVVMIEIPIETNAHLTIQWEKFYGGPYEDYIFSIEPTSDGGYILVGYTSGGYLDGKVWLIKTDSQGNEQWIKKYDRNMYDVGHSVKQTSDGGYIITGLTGTFSGSTHDLWLIKTDSNGNKQWDKVFDKDGIGDNGNSILQTSDGGYIICGRANGGDGKRDGDIWVIKTDSSGDIQWDKVFGKGGYYEDEGHSIQQTYDGGYIIIGLTESYGPRGYNIWLIKIDSFGNEQWNKVLGGWYQEYGYSVKQTSDGGFILTGETWSYGAGGGDLWLVKIDSLGNEQWNKTFGGSLEDRGMSIQITSDNGYIIGGFTQSYGAGWSDAWLVKTDSLGNEQWNQTFGGNDWDDCPSVKQTTDNYYIMVVGTRSYGPGDYDVWLIKLGPSEPSKQPPIADAGPDQTMNEGDVVWLDGSNSKGSTSGSGQTWTKYMGNPVLDLGSSNSWENQLVWAPRVIYDDGKYHNGGFACVQDRIFEIGPFQPPREHRHEECTGCTGAASFGRSKDTRINASENQGQEHQDTPGVLQGNEPSLPRHRWKGWS